MSRFTTFPTGAQACSASIQTATWKQNSLGNIDLKQLADDLQGRGIELPALVRLTDVAKPHPGTTEAFNQTITERNYQGHYRGVYPVKVNQQRQLIDEVIQFSALSHGIGMWL